MVIVSEVGGQCDISMQGKFPLFSQTQYDQTLKDAGFEIKVDTQNNNQVFYQKGDVIVFANFNQYSITLRMFNTISIQTKYSEFATLLAKLNFKPESMAVMVGDFKTFVTDVGNPHDFLNKFLNEKTKSSFGEQLQIDPSVLSIVLANSSVQDSDMQVRLEPLHSSPQDTLFISILFRTTNYTNFNNFVLKFGADFIRDMIENIVRLK